MTGPDPCLVPSSGGGGGAGARTAYVFNYPNTTTKENTMPELHTNLETPIVLDVPTGNPDVRVVAANTPQGLTVDVVDIVDQAPEAFPPRDPAERTVTDQASWLNELKRRPFVDSTTGTVWANRERGTVTAVYDELHPDPTDPYTRRRDRLTLRFVPHPDWQTAMNIANGTYFSQGDFGDLLESAGHLIVSHAAADLLEIVDTIRASTKGSFESKIHRATGSQTVSYSEEVSARAGGTATKQLEVPREVTLRVAKYEDYPPLELKCWLRLRVGNGSLGLALVPQPYAHTIRDAWETVLEHLADESGYTIYSSNIR